MVMNDIMEFKNQGEKQILEILQKYRKEINNLDNGYKNRIEGLETQFKQIFYMHQSFLKGDISLDQLLQDACNGDVQREIYVTSFVQQYRQDQRNINNGYQAKQDDLKQKYQGILGADFNKSFDIRTYDLEQYVQENWDVFQSKSLRWLKIKHNKQKLLDELKEYQCALQDIEERSKHSAYKQLEKELISINLSLDFLDFGNSDLKAFTRFLGLPDEEFLTQLEKYRTHKQLLEKHKISRKDLKKLYEDHDLSFYWKELFSNLKDTKKDLERYRIHKEKLDLGLRARESDIKKQYERKIGWSLSYPFDIRRSNLRDFVDDIWNSLYPAEIKKDAQRILDRLEQYRADIAKLDAGYSKQFVIFEFLKTDILNSSQGLYHTKKSRLEKFKLRETDMKRLYENSIEFDSIFEIIFRKLATKIYPSDK
ncbi:hypothetical protein LCGC14_2251090, partial [marine sediment metagenome]